MHCAIVLREICKRSFDFVFALFLLVLLAVPLLIIAFTVRVSLGKPILFRQTRPGKDGTLFELLKFRTMKEAYSSAGAPLPDAVRLSRLGRFLRLSSLDELPELINVLRGEMSLVGPRPLLEKYLPLYTPRQLSRHKVRPGITGWAQVNGRNATDWDTRLELDAWYVENQSLALDLKILWMTVGVVFSAKGVSADGHATMPEFQGSEHAV